MGQDDEIGHEGSGGCGVKVRVKQAGQNGKLHWLPGAHAYTALCGATDTKGDWMPVSTAASIFWGDCKRCASIKAKSEKVEP